MKRKKYQFIKFEPNDLLKLVDEQEHHTSLSIDLFETDWEVVKEPKKIKLRDMTEEQWENFTDKCYVFACMIKKCPFMDIGCDIDRYSSWYAHKDLYSDKFLDQEVEIEED